jgi:hypothetical protein
MFTGSAFAETTLSIQQTCCRAATVRNKRAT